MSKLVVDSQKKGVSLNLKELFSYRDLFLILAYRDLRVRYAQTFLGLTWAILQPITTLFIFVIIFGRAIKVDTGGIPYPLFALTGMVNWTYFSFVLNQSGNSIISAQEMVKKIYFPRLIIPLSKAIVGFVDFLVTAIFLLILMVYYKMYPPANVLYAPIFVVCTILASLGVGIWLSALTIRYRDFQHIVPFLVQIGLYATPIAYPSSLIPDKYLTLFYLNPMAGIVEGFRWSLLGVGTINNYIFLSLAVIILIFVSGVFYFKKVEKVIADIV